MDVLNAIILYVVCAELWGGYGHGHFYIGLGS